MPKREYLLRHRRAVGQNYHPRTATRRDKKRQREATSRLAADVLPAPDVIACWLVDHGYGLSFACLVASQMRARAAKGCAVTLAVLRQLEDEAAL